MNPELLAQLEDRCDDRAFRQATTEMMLNVIAARSFADNAWVDAHRDVLVSADAKVLVQNAKFACRYPPILDVSFSMEPRMMDSVPEPTTATAGTLGNLQQQYELDLLNQMA